MKKILVKIILTIIVAFPLNFYAQNPNWQWAKLDGSSGKDSGQKIEIDSQGNVYVLGVFRDNNMTIGTTTLINAGSDDVFLAKYSSLGNLIWAKSIGNTGLENAGNLIIDNNDDIYISGSFSSSTLTIGVTVLPNSGSFDFFIAKYDSSGQVVWAKNSSNSNFNAGVVAVDDDLNSYSVTTTSTTATIEKYNSIDNLIWSKTITTTGTISTVNVRGFFVDASGVYITGGFFGTTLTIESTTLINSTPQNSNDMYVARLDTSGNLLWAKNANCTAGDFGKNIKVDSAGNSYVLGNFANGSPIIFDSFSLTTNGENDLFLVKYNSLGQVIWARNAGGIYNDWVFGLAIDGSGGAYVIGEFYSSDFTFANTTYSNLGAPFSYSDIYIVKYGASGNESWIRAVPGLGNDDGNDIAVNSAGEVYVTGAIEDTLGGVTNVGSFSLSSYGLDDFFLGKLSATVSVDEKTENTFLSIYPNPNNGSFTISIDDSNLTDSRVKLYNISGQLILQTLLIHNVIKIDLAKYPKGMYFVNVSTGKRTIVKKVVYY